MTDAYVQIALDTFVNLLHPLFKFVRRKVFVPVVDSLELAAINGNNGLAEQVELAAENHKPLAHVTDAFAVIVTEVSNGLEIRG